MNILAVNTWFVTLIKQFFFSLDQVVFNFISEIYDLLISIARTSILTQADISAMAEKIYALLTVFMVFKVTLSLITYVVNPDDFADKSKGLSKLGTNIIISLSLLVLTPYIFSYAFELQTIILEDNSLAKLIFETKGNSEDASFINTAGDEIAYTAMSAFFTPNVSIDKLRSCVDFNGTGGFDPNCSGVEKNGTTYTANTGLNGGNTMVGLLGEGKKSLVINYVVGVENHNLGLMFRQDLAVATTENKEYIMEYKFIFSTVVGVVIILLLLTYCMDVAVRSIKLSFLQLIAPIPILSYVDPKSGKDGLFKKWYNMCFKTYLSLFVRLLALYFAIYIIGRVGNMVDIVDGSSVTDTKIKIFVIIGALMFAKQLPKMLEGLGIKLDGDGKFTLNPLKKFEEGALGGKNITGMARGALVGTAGMFSGAGAMAGLSGAWRGLTSGKGWKETGKATAEMNRKMRQAKLDGSTFGGRIGARLAGTLGVPSASENIEGRIHSIDEEIKNLDNSMAPSKKRAEEKKLYTSAVDAMEKRAISKIENGEAGILSEQYRSKQAHIDALKAQLDAEARLGKDTTSIERNIAKAENEMRNYLNDTAMKQYIDANRNASAVVGKDMDGNDITAAQIFGVDSEGKAKNDAALKTMTSKMEQIVQTYGANHDNMKDGSAADLHKNLGTTKGEITEIENKNEESEKKKRDLEESKKQYYEKQRKAKADETAIK